MRRADIEVPNPDVDVNSWSGSACYPRRTFYPLSDGPSIQNHRITKAWFPTCSTCKSYSQAPFCFYTRRLISKQPEGTFASLRYDLGGDRPSQTAGLALSRIRMTTSVRTPALQGWYFTVPSTEPSGPASKGTVKYHPRSEEHTSELQSHTFISY